MPFGKCRDRRERLICTTGLVLQKREVPRILTVSSSRAHEGVCVSEEPSPLNFGAKGHTNNLAGWQPLALLYGPRSLHGKKWERRNELPTSKLWACGICQMLGQRLMRCDAACNEALRPNNMYEAHTARRVHLMLIGGTAQPMKIVSP